MAYTTADLILQMIQPRMRSHDTLLWDEVYKVVRLMSKIPHHILKTARDRNFAVTVRVGKSGLTENILNEISEQLSARGLVKIKFNRGIFSNEDKELSIEMICTQCNAILVDAKGNVAIVYHP